MHSLKVNSRLWLFVEDRISRFLFLLYKGFPFMSVLFDGNRALRSNEIDRNDSGAVLIEFSMIAWIFVLFITLTVDIGQMLHHYMVLSQLTFEGARTASMIDGLQKPLVLTVGPTEDEKEECAKDMKATPRVSALPCALLLAQHRMRQSISFTDIGESLDAYQVTTSYDGAANVSVELQATYKALFLPLRFVPLKASTTLPYVVLGAKEKVKERGN